MHAREPQPQAMAEPPMTVIHLPSPLFSYTGGRARVNAAGATLAEVLDGLDAKFPGLKFRIIDEQDRIRHTILFHVNGDVVRELDHPIGPDDEVHVVAALSGG